MAVPQAMAGFEDTGRPFRLARGYTRPRSRDFHASHDFVCNNVASDGQAAGFGNTTYNLFSYVIITPTTPYLGSPSSLTVTALPEPASLCLTAGSLAAAGLWLRRGFLPARSSPRR